MPQPHRRTITTRSVTQPHRRKNTSTFRYTVSPWPWRRTSAGSTPSATPTHSGTQPHHSLTGGNPQDQRHMQPRHLQVHRLPTASQEDILRINAISNTNTFSCTASPQPHRRASSGSTKSAIPTPSVTQPHRRTGSTPSATPTPSGTQPHRRTSSGSTPSTTPTPTGTQPYPRLAGGHSQQDQRICLYTWYAYTLTIIKSSLSVAANT
jgi:hypothetical protein